LHWACQEFCVSGRERVMARRLLGCRGSEAITKQQDEMRERCEPFP
jgi:hypothetical protein